MIARRVPCAALSLCLAASLAVAARPQPQPSTPPEQRAAAWEQHRQLEEDSLFRGLPWRSVGPIVMGGRIVDLEVVPGKPYSFLVAYASGGLWRTDNNGNGIF